MKDTLGVGLIGCGAISANHFKALKQLDGAKLVAVCDCDPAHLAKAMEEQQVKGYADDHDLLADPEVDVVHVCTPHYLHHQMTVDALKAGKHVLSEKPMAIHLSDAEDMARTARETGRQLGICFQNRYNGATLRIRSLLDSGEAGKVLGGHGTVIWDRGEAYYASVAWRGKWATEGGGVLINQAIHTLDLLRDFAGDPVVDVKCSMSAKRLEDTIEVEDTCDLLMTTSGGARLLFYASNGSVGNTSVQVYLKCEKATIHMVGSRVTVCWNDGRVESEDYASGRQWGKDYWGDGHAHLIADFYRCLKENKPFPIDGDEALKTTRIVEAAYTAAHAGNRGRCE